MKTTLKNSLKNKLPKTRDTDKRYSYLYIFKLVSKQPVVPEELKKLFEQFHESNSKKDDRKKIKLCKLNNQPKLVNVLYVGQSKTLITRFWQHMGYGHKGTYSMHLKHWLKGFDKPLNFSYYEFPEYSNDTIQALEDGLWDILMPMFGKKGSK